MHRADFAYDLPEELIAQTPLAERSASRLLVLDGTTGAFQDRTLRDLPELLEPGDLLVFNDTRVVAARLMGIKPSGGRVEIFLERALEGDQALVQLQGEQAHPRGARDRHRGRVGARARQGKADLWRVQLPAPALEFFEQHGDVPLPPYIQRAPARRIASATRASSREQPGAVAAPTASLHFDAALIAALEKRGVARAFVTLHVGAGTFQPVRVDDLGLARDACGARRR